MPTLKYEKLQALLQACAFHDATRGYNRPQRQRFAHWFTTTPHPTRPAHTHGADDGQVGWCLHAVIAHPSAHERGAAFTPRAVCGLRAKHGWGVDLFIDEPCSKCLRAAIKRRLTLPSLP